MLAISRASVPLPQEPSPRPQLNLRWLGHDEAALIAGVAGSTGTDAPQRPPGKGYMITMNTCPFAARVLEYQVHTQNKRHAGAMEAVGDRVLARETRLGR